LVQQVLPARPDLSVIAVTHDDRELALATLQSATQAVGELLPLMTIVHHAGRSERPDLFAQRTHSKLLFARKHLSRGSRVAFRAALTVRHALRTAVFAPVAAARPARRARLQADAAALGIVLGLRGPSWSRSMRSGTERTAIGHQAMAREDRGSV
jgi:hypothetical protein